jgi:transcriptional regulator with XRE-family HTH domain
MNIGENIKRIREIKRLTQEGVAKSLGMSVTALPLSAGSLRQY